ncbi:MAG: sigma-70 family RNA polymerase sigma factor [Bacteroidales bacterium]|nr:sigma-70 family RNA polymerase sigma factor [Bacteroidales bacterium]MDD4293506.1 sigma-70 family RNA polymerase sigma factor [Bacteroidales bacterium]HNW48461.1 sigma-70 family RNA polymerase sigma factor [Bacteroidales bacterium]HPS95235.1 sigma-70 family RNA polymerase sigma factor [Bacteroidales bacterium]
MTEQEFNILVQRLRPKLINFAGGFVKTGAATAEDMVQDAVIKLWRTQEIQEVKNHEALTLHILKNVCIDYLRLKKNNTESLNVNSTHKLTDDPVVALERKDQFAFLRGCIDTLPSDQMLAVRLRDIMGYEMEEIAVILDTTEGNVRTLLSRARQKLREKILMR